MNLQNLSENFLVGTEIINKKMDNKGKKAIFSFMAVVVFFVAGFFLLTHYVKKPIQNIPANIKYVEIGGQSVRVDLALTDAEQQQGLSGRKSLAKNEGMLFVFNKPGRYFFWMKDMNFPIDMIWLGENMKVVYVKKDARPELYPETYGPSVDAKYVLEVPDNFSNQNNLKIGDNIEFTY